MNIPDCYDPVYQAEAREDAWSKTLATLPHAHTSKAMLDGIAFEDYIKCPQDGCESIVSWKDNGEPYEEPTPTEAEKNISAEEKRENELIYTLKYIIRTADFELLNRLEVRDNRTGKIWR